MPLLATHFLFLLLEIPIFLLMELNSYKKLIETTNDEGFKMKIEKAIQTIEEEFKKNSSK
jgi:hypothetical protein